MRLMVISRSAVAGGFSKLAAADHTCISDKSSDRFLGLAKVPQVRRLKDFVLDEVRKNRSDRSSVIRTSAWVLRYHFSICLAYASDTRWWLRGRLRRLYGLSGTSWVERNVAATVKCTWTARLGTWWRENSGRQSYDPPQPKR